MSRSGRVRTVGVPAPALALPNRFRHTLTHLPRELPVSWYHDPSSALEAASSATVLWFDPVTAGRLEKLLLAGEHLAWVSCQRVGVDDLPLRDLMRRGIRLTNGAGQYATAIAEYVMMALLSWAKGLAVLIHAQDRQDWLPAPPTDRGLAGGSALIIGYGSTGRAVAKRLHAFGIHSVGVRSRAHSKHVIGPDDWRSRLAEFDFVVLCTPLTADTLQLIGEEEIAGMKHGAWLANISRGLLVDTDALVAALKGGHLGGAYLDVTEPEPLPKDHVLWRLPTVLITPHTSWASATFNQRTSDFFLANVDRFRSGAPLRNQVNLRAGY